MALSWNEIKERAVKFSKEWANTTNEEADAKPLLRSNVSAPAGRCDNISIKFFKNENVFTSMMCTSQQYKILSMVNPCIKLIV